MPYSTTEYPGLDDGASPEPGDVQQIAIIQSLRRRRPPQDYHNVIEADFGNNQSPTDAQMLTGPPPPPPKPRRDRQDGYSPVLTPEPPMTYPAEWAERWLEKPPAKQRDQFREETRIIESLFAAAPAVPNYVGNAPPPERFRFCRKDHRNDNQPLPESGFGTVDYTPDYWAPRMPPERPRPIVRREPDQQPVIMESLFAEPSWLRWQVQPAEHRPPKKPIDVRRFSTQPIFFFPEYGDAVRFHLTGAGSDGAAQADPDAALGNFRSSVEATRVGVIQSEVISGVSVIQSSRDNGADGDVGSLFSLEDNIIQYAAPDGAFGDEVVLAYGDTKTISDGDDPSKWIRVTRTSTTSIVGSGIVEFVDQFNNVFGMLNAANTEAVSGGNRYRGVMVTNASLSNVTSVKFYVMPLDATPKQPLNGTLGASGAGTLRFATDAVIGWPWTGWARIIKSNGDLREIVYYESRTESTLVVSANGRGRLGTSADAGLWSDSIYPIPGIRIATEAASPAYKGSIQTIASESTAPTSVTWSTAITAATGLAVATIKSNENVGLWIHRELPATTMATAKLMNQIGVSYSVEGRTYHETLAGLYRVANDALDRYELHIGVGAEPNINATPTETSSSLPFTTSTVLGVSTTNYLVVNKRNKYNLRSESMATTVIKVTAGGAQDTVKPSAPEVVEWVPSAAGTFTVTAVYYYEQDADAVQADQWLVYFTSNGVDPNPSVDTPTVSDITKSDGAAFLEYTTAGFSTGTTGKVLVRVRRASDTSDSANTDISTATADATVPGTPTGGIFWRKIAEQTQ